MKCPDSSLDSEQSSRDTEESDSNSEDEGTKMTKDSKYDPPVTIKEHKLSHLPEDIRNLG